MVVSYLRDVAAVLQLRRLASGELLRELPLPGLGSVGGFSGDRKGTEFFFSYTSEQAAGLVCDWGRCTLGLRPCMQSADKRRAFVSRSSRAAAAAADEWGAAEEAAAAGSWERGRLQRGPQGHRVFLLLHK